MCHHYMEKLVH